MIDKKNKVYAEEDESMIIYVSPATDDDIYNREFIANALTGGQQAQKFNSLLIRGLSSFTRVISIANLPYKLDKKNERLQEEIKKENIQYIRVKNRTGRLTHKISNVLSMIKEIKKIVKAEKPTALVCDAVNLASSAACRYCSKRLNIPSVAIVTDIPEFMSDANMSIWMKLCNWLMKKHDAYVLLTEQMNDIVNPKGKPYIIVEGSCEKAGNSDRTADRDTPPVCLFTGSLGSNAGLEQMIEGFIKSGTDIAELHFYGNGDFVPELKKTCEKYPKVKYFGLVQNNISVEKQQSATMLINPRRTDLKYCKYSFPSKLMEYMASGTPVLTTHLPGIPKEYDDYLIYVEDETADGFATKIREVLDMNEQKRNDLGMRARNYVLSRKNNVAQAQEIFKLCNDIVRHD